MNIVKGIYLNMDNNMDNNQRVSPRPEKFHYWFYGNAIDYGTHIEFKMVGNPQNNGVSHKVLEMTVVHVSQLKMQRPKMKILKKN